MPSRRSSLAGRAGAATITLLGTLAAGPGEAEPSYDEVGVFAFELRRPDAMVEVIARILVAIDTARRNGNPISKLDGLKLRDASVSFLRDARAPFPANGQPFDAGTVAEHLTVAFAARVAGVMDVRVVILHAGAVPRR